MARWQSTLGVVEFQCRPIQKWPRELTRHRRRAPFRAGYGDTNQLLARELAHLKAKSVVLLMAVREGDVRLDGRPRADARPEHPGVIVVAETPRGQLQFPCDAFDNWVANLLAVALSLEALRKVDRYGVTSHGEQYTGWKALPNPNHQMTSEEALKLVRRISGRIDPQEAIRTAEKLTHPDAGGNPDDFKRVQEARRVLLGNGAAQ